MEKAAMRPTCCICRHNFDSPVISNCGHMFCYRCLGGYLKNDPKCPVCGKKMTIDDVTPIFGHGDQIMQPPKDHIRPEASNDRHPTANINPPNRFLSFIMHNRLIAEFILAIIILMMISLFQYLPVSETVKDPFLVVLNFLLRIFI